MSSRQLINTLLSDLRTLTQTALPDTQLIASVEAIERLSVERIYGREGTISLPICVLVPKAPQRRREAEALDNVVWDVRVEIYRLQSGVGSAFDLLPNLEILRDYLLTNEPPNGGQCMDAEDFDWTPDVRLVDEFIQRKSPVIAGYISAIFRVGYIFGT